MSNQEPLMRLVEIVNDQLKQGKEEREIVSLLVSSGLEEQKARQVVDTVKASRGSHFLGILRFFVVSFLAVSILTFSVYTTVGAEQFVTQARWYTGAFLLCFIIFGVLAGIKGKVVVYARLVNSAFWFASSFMLMVAMFMHPGWEGKWWGTGGGWRGQLVSLAGNVIYNIGSTGIAYILVAVSLIVLLVSWAELHRIKTEDFDAV